MELIGLILMLIGWAMAFEHIRGFIRGEDIFTGKKFSWYKGDQQNKMIFFPLKPFDDPPVYDEKGNRLINPFPGEDEEKLLAEFYMHECYDFDNGWNELSGCKTEELVPGTVFRQFRERKEELGKWKKYYDAREKLLAKRGVH